MADSVQLANKDFTFSDLTLANPQGLQGGAYFSKLRMYDKPVLIQTPKCLTKNGIHKTEKKIYCDLMFTEDNNDFIEWIGSLETTVKNLIYEKRTMWFHNDMEYDSIDYHWQNLLRTYKGNKSLLRCFINKPKGLSRNRSIQIYNQEEEELKLDDIQKTDKMISILEISGLKFTSQSFQIEFIIKQIMVIKEKPLFDKCLIRFNTLSKKNKPDETVQDSDAESDISIEEETTNIIKDNELQNLSEEHVVEDKINNQNKDTLLDISSNKESEESLSDIQEQTEEQEQEQTQEQKTPDDKTEPDEFIEDLSKNNTVPSLENLEKSEKGLEQINIQEESLDKNGIINEIEILAPSESTDIVKLKNPSEVYMEIYKEARRKAKNAKKHAIQAYLEAKRIKSLYLLDEIESSDDDEEFEEYDR